MAEDALRWIGTYSRSTVLLDEERDLEAAHADLATRLETYMRYVLKLRAPEPLETPEGLAAYLLNSAFTNVDWLDIAEETIAEARERQEAETH